MPDAKTMPLLPLQAAPLRRREVLQPAQTVDLVNGDPERLFRTRIALVHGANDGAPAWFDHEAAAARGILGWY